MKINDINRVRAVNPYKNTQVTNVSSPKAKATDAVHISAEAKELLGSVQMGASTERLEQLKQAVRTGTYHIDSGKLAERLLPHILED